MNTSTARRKGRRILRRVSRMYYRDAKRCDLYVTLTPEVCIERARYWAREARNLGSPKGV